MNKWISVNDRLPDNSNVVLAYNLKNSRGIYIHKIYFAFYYEYRWTQSNDAAWKMDVTHWMPLPNPPKEESESIGNIEQLNAIELANELKDFHNDNSNSMYDICFNPIYLTLFNDSADMLLKQEQKIEKLKKDLHNVIVRSAQEITQLRSDLEDCTCQGGHSEAYLKAKGKL
jgi:hypothetical protein